MPVLFVALVSTRCSPPAVREIEAFRTAYRGIELAYTQASARQAQAAERAWDDVVVALLNSGGSPASINKVLASLPGSDLPTGATPERAALVSEWPDYGAAYALFPVRVGTAEIWIGVCRFGGGWVAGHVSVISRTDGRWRKTAVLDADNVLEAYPIAGPTVPTFVVIERLPGADGYSGELRMWEVMDGLVIKRGQPQEPLYFYNVERSTTGPRISYGAYAKCLGMPHSHLAFNRVDMSVAVVGGRAAVETRSATPWVAAVDEACAAVHALKLPAIENRESLAAGIDALSAQGVVLWDAKGDLAAGAGSVTVTPNQTKFLRFEVRRESNRSWTIVSVMPVADR